MEYPCPHDGCALKLADRHALKAHYGDAHGDPGAYSQFCCPFDDCSGRFTSKALLQSHQVSVCRVDGVCRFMVVSPARQYRTVSCVRRTHV